METIVSIIAIISCIMMILSCICFFDGYRKLHNKINITEKQILSKSGLFWLGGCLMFFLVFFIEEFLT